MAPRFTRDHFNGPKKSLAPQKPIKCFSRIKKKISRTCRISSTLIVISHLSVNSSRIFCMFPFCSENEHLNNCGQFRVVRDISIAPLDMKVCNTSFLIGCLGFLAGVSLVQILQFAVSYYWLKCDSPSIAELDILFFILQGHTPSHILHTTIAALY